MFNVHPECLGKWSNLTSIFFNWVAHKPTRIALDRTESVCPSFAWLMCSRALKFIKSQDQKSNKIDMPLPASLKKRYVKFHAYQLCSTMGMCMEFYAFNVFCLYYSQKHPGRLVSDWESIRKKWVFSRGQSYGSRCGTVCGYGLRLKKNGAPSGAVGWCCWP